MPRRRSSSAGKGRLPRWLAALAALALVLFGAGQLVAFLASDPGHVFVFRWLHVGDRARIVRIVSRHVREGLAAAHVPPGAVSEDVVPLGGGGAPRWRVALGRDGSPLQVNYAVTRAVESAGAEVLSGREEPGADGALTVTLEIGMRGRPLQQVVVTRPGRPRDKAKKLLPEAKPARVAVVVLGLSESPGLVHALLARREPFAVAAPAGGGRKDPLRHAIHASGHELVLMMPMEPENYPHVNPGPGTLLVNMPARRVRGRLSDELRDAGAVVAVANLMGSFATQDETFMTAFFDELREQGVPFLHLSPVPRAVCRTLAASLGIAYDEPDATVEGASHAKTQAAQLAAWKEALDKGVKHGRAIVILRVTPKSAKWIDEAFAPATLGTVTLVPLSGVMHHAETR